MSGLISLSPVTIAAPAAVETAAMMAISVTTISMPAAVVAVAVAMSMPMLAACKLAQNGTA
jgi:hypothetical protein